MRTAAFKSLIAFVNPSRNLRRLLPLALLLLMLQGFNVFKPLDDGLWDVWTRTLPAREPSPVVLVTIDESTLAQYGRISGWDRRMYVQAISHLKDAGASAIGLDILFPERSAQDREFIQGVQQPGVVLADAELFGERVPRHPELQNATYGAILLNTSSGNIARSFQTAYTFASDGKTYPGFAAQLVQQAGQPVTTSENQQYLRYNAPPGQGFLQLSFSEVIRGNFRYGDVQDKVVLIGVTAGGIERDQVLSPFSNSPLGDPLPIAGVEAQATAVHTLLKGGFITLPTWGMGVVTALAFLLVALSQVRGRAVGVLVVLLLALQGFLHVKGIILPLSALLMAVTGGLLLRLIFAFAEVQQGITLQLRRLNQQFNGQEASLRSPLKRLQLLQEIEEKLAQERARLQVLLDNVDTPMFLAQAGGQITLQNPSSQRLLGDAPALSKLQEIFDLPDLAEGMERVLQGQGSYESLSETGLITLRPLASGGLVGTITPTNRFTHLLEQHDQQAAAIVHDFRSPLTSILGFSQLLESEATQEQKEILGIMRSEARRIADLIDDFLMVSRTKAAILDIREMDLAALVRRAATVAAPMFTEKHMTLQLDLPRTLFVDMDDRAMTRAILNLLSNAVKYSSPHTEVQVKLRTEGNDVCLSVQDHGVGLSEEDQRRLFGRFFRSNNPAIREVKGTGLGLHTVKELVKAHGGEILVDSSIGKGSTFTIRLPIRELAQVPELT